MWVLMKFCMLYKNTNSNQVDITSLHCADVTIY